MNGTNWYFPLAHMVWGPGGFMNGIGNFDKAGIKAIDFAGGTVVHMSSGWSALVLALILGKLSGFGAKAFKGGTISWWVFHNYVLVLHRANWPDNHSDLLQQRQYNVNSRLPAGRS